MRKMFSKSDLRFLSSVVALVMLLASVPLTAGLVIGSSPSQPEFTVNICQPMQMFDSVSNLLVARPATMVPEFVLCDQGSVAVELPAAIKECPLAPDTPPPKQLV